MMPKDGSDTISTEQQPAGVQTVLLPEEDDAVVAFISLSADGAAAAAPKAAASLQVCCTEQQLPEQCTAPPAGAAQAAIASPPSSPTGWKSRVFNTAREPQQAPVPPPGCLLLDGEALLRNEYEEDPQQQQQPWQQQQRQLGCDSDSSCGTRRSTTERKQQQPARMSGSSSSPNLVLLADGSHTAPSMQQALLQEYPQQQQQQQQQQGSELLPMHSNQSCDSLLALCHTAPSFSTGLGPLGSTAAAAAAQNTFGSGAAPKSRLGRPTGGETPRSLQAQQEQPQQQSPEASQLTSQQQWQQLQEQAQQRRQQLQQQRLLGFSSIGGSADGATNTTTTTSSSSWPQQQGFSPQPRAGGSVTPQQDEWPTTVGVSSGSTRVTSWTFSRCSSGLSLGSCKSLRVHCVTFNMNGKLPASLPPEMLGECGGLMEGTAADAGADGSPDLLVFATQENNSPSEWEKLLGGLLGPAGYERLAWHSLRAIHLVLYAGRRFRRQVVGIHASSVATGIGNVVGNKGAVALSVELLDIKLLFISSHLAAHGDQVQQRNADYLRIKAGLFATPAATTTPRSGASTDRSLRGMRRGGSVDIPRVVPLSAPSRVGNSDGGAKSPRTLDSSSGGLLAGSGGSSVWSGFLRSNRVMDSSPFEESGSPAAAAAARKRVSWWSELSNGGASPSCSSPLLSIAPSGASEGCLLGHSHGSCSPATAAAVSSQVDRLRMASCPAMDQPQQGGRGGAAAAGLLQYGSAGGASGSGSSWATSGDSSPFGSGQLSVVDRTGSASANFLRSLVGRQPGKGSGRPVDAVESHDVVFWLGDLNYRINGNNKAVRHLMRSRLHEVLHANDQLRLQQKMGTVFQGFQEGRIRFPPTFKFLPGSSAYSEKRVPSWTDRILWKVRSRAAPPQQQQAQQQPEQQQQQQQQAQQQQTQQTPEQQPQLSWVSGDGSMNDSGGALPLPDPPSVSQLYYTSVSQITISDHKPVVAGFEVGLVVGGEGEQSQHLLQRASSGSSSDDDDEEQGLRMQHGRCCCIM